MRDATSTTRYDHVPTGLLFFRVYGDSSSTRLLGSSTKWLGDHVPRVIALVRKATEVALAHEERARKWKQEQEEQREAARLLAKRQAHYEQWERLLLDQAKAWEQATRLRTFLASFGSTQRSPTAGAFLGWASGYTHMIDPTTTLQVPNGEPPAMPHDERLSRGRPTQTPNTFAPWL